MYILYKWCIINWLNDVHAEEAAFFSRPGRQLGRAVEDEQEQGKDMADSMEDEEDEGNLMVDTMEDE
jgi:hypothetical protein